MPLSRLFLSTAFLHPRTALPHTALFHTTSAWRGELASHYETLGLDPNVSAGDIKKYAITCMVLYQVLT